MREYDDIVERAFEDDGFVVEDQYDAVEDEDYVIEGDAQIFIDFHLMPFLRRVPIETRRLMFGQMTNMLYNMEFK